MWLLRTFTEVPGRCWGLKGLPETQASTDLSPQGEEGGSRENEVLSEYIVDIGTAMKRFKRPMGSWHSCPFRQNEHSPPEAPVLCACICVSDCCWLFFTLWALYAFGEPPPSSQINHTVCIVSSECLVLALTFLT